MTLFLITTTFSILLFRPYLLAFLAILYFITTKDKTYLRKHIKNWRGLSGASVGLPAPSLPPVYPSSLISCPMRAFHDSPIHGCRQIFDFSHICLAIVDYCRKWMSVRSGLITVDACDVMFAAASQGEGAGEWTVGFVVTFIQTLLCWPTCHKHLVYCLKIVVLKISLKSPLKHNHYCWAEISVSHQPDDGKGTRFASWDLVLDRLWWNIIAFPNIHHLKAVWQQQEEVEYMCHCGRT